MRVGNEEDHSDNSSAGLLGTEMQNETAPASSWEQFLDTHQWLLSYYVPKTVCVKSRWLGIPNLILKSIIGLYIFVFVMGIELKFFTSNAITARPIVHVEQPSRNFQTCHDIDADCEDLYRPMTDFPYCDKTALPEAFDECRYYDAHEVQPLKYEGSIFSATSFAELSQARCRQVGREGIPSHDKNCTKLWKTKSFQKHYVAGAEDFQVLIRHSITSKSGVLYSGFDAQGFMKDADSAISILPCHDGTCSYTTEMWNQTKACGKASSGPDTCFSSSRGDAISLKRLLEAANISLDERVGNTTLREIGVSLTLTVKYENMDPYDFWLIRPLGRKLKYTYSVKPMNFGNQSRFKVSKWGHLSTDPNERTLYTAYGVLFVIMQEGELGCFDLSGMLVTLAGALTLLRLADTIVAKFCVQLYKLSGLKSLHYVYCTYAYYTRDFTPRASEVQKEIPTFSDVDANQLRSLTDKSKREFWLEKFTFLRNIEDRYDSVTGIGSLLVFLIAVSSAMGLGSEK